MESLKEKTVSVVMCTYNGAQYLKEQLDSIIGQTYPIHELIIQDDCSTDNTVAILKKYEADYPFVKLYVNEHNIGYNQNFKSAVMKATGDYIAISDQDDVWFPQKLERQVNAIANYDICFSQYFTGNLLEDAVLFSKFNFSLESLIFRNVIPGHTMLIKKSFAQNNDVWIDGITYDWSLSVCAQMQNGIILFEEPLSWHRKHEESAIYKRQEKHFPNVHYSVYKPYLYGFSNYRKLQKKPLWGTFYKTLHKKTFDLESQIPYRLCGLLVNNHIMALIQLCFLCLRKRKVIYPSVDKASGTLGFFRAFFYPFIFSYNNSSFDEM